MPGHVLDEAGLAAASGPFQHNRKLRAVCRLEQPDLLADRQVVWLAPDDVFFYRLFYCGLICSHKRVMRETRRSIDFSLCPSGLTSKERKQNKVYVTSRFTGPVSRIKDSFFSAISRLWVYF